MPDYYRSVSRRWLNVVSGLLLLMVLLIGYLTYLVFDLSYKMRAVETDGNILLERRKAFDEMMNNRMEVERFAYNRACQYAKEKGETCITSPKFFADPENYPLLKNTRNGVGLFPPAPEPSK